MRYLEPVQLSDRTSSLTIGISPGLVLNVRMFFSITCLQQKSFTQSYLPANSFSPAFTLENPTTRTNLKNGIPRKTSFLTFISITLRMLLLHLRFMRYLRRSLKRQDYLIDSSII